MSSERQRLARQLYDRHQLFQVVDAQLQDMRSARHVVVGDEHRVTVGRTLDRRLDADGPARTRAVLDHDLLADRARHRFADDTRDEIKSASGRKRHDEADRPIGPRGLGRALRACRVRTMRRLGDTAEQRDATCCRAFDKRPPLDLGQFFLPSCSLNQFSTLMLACATILPNFSVSAATNSRYCAAVMIRGTMPWASSVSEIARSRRPVTTISLRRATIGLGVAAGANSPNQLSSS